MPKCETEALHVPLTIANVSAQNDELHLFPPSVGPRRHVDISRQYGSNTSLGELPLDPQVSSAAEGANSHIVTGMGCHRGTTELQETHMCNSHKNVKNFQIA